MPYIATAEVEAAAAKLAAAQALAKKEQLDASTTLPPVYEYLNLKKTGKHTITPKDG